MLTQKDCLKLKSLFFLIADESGECLRGKALGGSGAMLPQKILKSWCSEKPFPVF